MLRFTKFGGLVAFLLMVLISCGVSGAIYLATGDFSIFPIVATLGIFSSLSTLTGKLPYAEYTHVGNPKHN